MHRDSYIKLPSSAVKVWAEYKIAHIREERSRLFKKLVDQRRKKYWWWKYLGWKEPTDFYVVSKLSAWDKAFCDTVYSRQMDVCNELIEICNHCDEVNVSGEILYQISR